VYLLVDLYPLHYCIKLKLLYFDTPLEINLAQVELNCLILNINYINLQNLTQRKLKNNYLRSYLATRVWFEFVILC
jgi:hypothetical protein